MKRERLDVLLVSRGLAESRTAAQRLLLAGAVKVNGQPAGKAGHLVPDDADLQVAGGKPFASRGGEKLAAALQHFALSVSGQVCLDVGASTGGFTDCLLQQGAARVYAVDGGHGQLDWRLRNDPRVVVREGVNARYLAPADFPEPIGFATLDVSFISLTLVLPSATNVVADGARLVTLIKPQFEAGRAQVGKGGVVRDAAVRQQVVERIREFGTNALPLVWDGVVESPLRGPAGNVEFLACWTRKPRAAAGAEGGA